MSGDPLGGSIHVLGKSDDLPGEAEERSFADPLLQTAEGLRGRASSRLGLAAVLTSTGKKIRSCWDRRSTSATSWGCAQR